MDLLVGGFDVFTYKWKTNRLKRASQPGYAFAFAAHFINVKNSKTTLHRVLQVNVHSISCHPIANTAALLSKSTLATVLTAKICYILHNYSSVQVAIS